MKKRVIALILATITIFGMLTVPASVASLKDSGTVTIQQAGYGNYLSSGEIFLYDLEPGTYLVKEIATDDAHVVNSPPSRLS